MKGGRRWLRLALAGAAAIAIVWLSYRATAMRRPSHRMADDAGCQSDPETVADMSRFAAGAAAIACQPWDVGTGVAGYVWPARDPRAVLLLEHGWGDYSQRYVKQSAQLIPNLLARGISVYAIDMWGNGRSPGARGATDLEDAVEDHLAARRKLREEPLPLFLLGHSVGGLVTATSTLRDPDRVRGMILVAPTLAWGVSGIMQFVARAGAFFLPTLAVPAPPGDPAHQSRDLAFTGRLARDPLYHSASISWVTAGSGVATSEANWTLYQQLTLAVLVVNGTADQVTKPEAARAFIDAVRSSDKSLVLIDGGRHALLDDPPANAEALEIILDWIERRLAPAKH